MGDTVGLPSRWSGDKSETRVTCGSVTHTLLTENLINFLKNKYFSICYVFFVVVQLLSHIQLFGIPWTALHQASLSFTISQSLLKFMSIESVMPSNRLILCLPLLLPSVFPSIRAFSSELAHLIRWPTYWSFTISPLREYSGLISLQVCSPCSLRDSQESSPVPQFEGISSLALISLGHF